MNLCLEVFTVSSAVACLQRAQLSLDTDTYFIRDVEKINDIALNRYNTNTNCIA